MAVIFVTARWEGHRIVAVPMKTSFASANLYTAFHASWPGLLNRDKTQACFVSEEADRRIVMECPRPTDTAI